ncbi:MAG TPA: SEC-C metal-binding domain-containing protein [Kofleriaceae bacterium]|nr:SEC-C metal-binding domain-containing protein [Kofleriaceae bacterium]
MESPGIEGVGGVTAAITACTEARTDARAEPRAELRAEPEEAALAPALALDRASLAHLIAEPAACDERCIRAALERADYDDATIRVLGRVKLGLPLPPELVADVLVGVERMDVFFSLARHADSDALPALLGLLDRWRFSDDTAGIHQTSYAAFALWQLGRPEVVRPVLVPRLRRLVRRLRMFVRATGLVGWLATQLADPHLTALCEEHVDETGIRLADTMGRFALDLWNEPIDEILALLPERAYDHTIPGVPARAVPKVGRNEPCPCGSGKKFKRCCADRSSGGPAGAASPRAERLRALEPRLEADQIGRLSRADLALLDLSRLRDGAVLAVVRRQAELHDWRRACLALHELTRRQGPEAAAEYLDDVILDALRAGHYDAAREFLARQDETARDAMFQLEVALAARAPDALARLDALSRAAVAGTDNVLEVDLAYATLATLPALGILIARGSLHAVHEFDRPVLLERIEEARDELLLAPGDPAQALLASLGGAQAQQRAASQTEAERARLAQTAASLRAELDRAAGRLVALERQVADHQRELERAEREASPRAARTDTQEQERRALRGKIEELQALIRERNEERSELRRQLSDAIESKTESKADAHGAAEPAARVGAAGPAIAARAGEPDAEDDGFDAAVADLPAGGAPRAILVPRFAAAAAAALETVPRHIAAAALRVVGALAAGDPAAWRGIKQAKDMPFSVLMARVGIHHRLLLRADDALDVLDLVTRESLLTTLKRLRWP